MVGRDAHRAGSTSSPVCASLHGPFYRHAGRAGAPAEPPPAAPAPSPEAGTAAAPAADAQDAGGGRREGQKDLTDASRLSERESADR